MDLAWLCSDLEEEKKEKICIKSTKSHFSQFQSWSVLCFAFVAQNNRIIQMCVRRTVEGGSLGWLFWLCKLPISVCELEWDIPSKNGLELKTYTGLEYKNTLRAKSFIVNDTVSVKFSQVFFKRCLHWKSVIFNKSQWDSLTMLAIFMQWESLISLSHF